MEGLKTYRIKLLKGFIMYMQDEKPLKTSYTELINSNLMTLDQVCMIYQKKTVRSPERSLDWNFKSWKI